MAKKKKKTKKPKKTEPSDVPAWTVFCDPTFDEPYGSPYQWACWGLVIRDLRGYTGLDQAIFARLIGGYNRNQVGRYEAEQVQPPIDFWTKLARMFGLNITWAMTGKGLPYVLDFADSDERNRLFLWTALADERKDFLKQLGEQP